MKNSISARCGLRCDKCYHIVLPGFLRFGLPAGSKGHVRELGRFLWFGFTVETIANQVKPYPDKILVTDVRRSWSGAGPKSRLAAVKQECLQIIFHMSTSWKVMDGDIKVFVVFFVWAVNVWYHLRNFRTFLCYSSLLKSSIVQAWQGSKGWRHGWKESTS